MTIDPTLRGRTTQEKILTAIVDRLIDKIDRLNDQNCILADQAIPVNVPGGRFIVTVSPGSGSFVGQMFAGAGADTLSEDGSAIITPIVIQNLDRPRQSRRRLVGTDDQTLGLYEWKAEILSALFGYDDWEPADDDQPLLREQLAPLRCDAPADVQIASATATAMKIIVSTVFDWQVRPL